MNQEWAGKADRQKRREISAAGKNDKDLHRQDADLSSAFGGISEGGFSIFGICDIQGNAAVLFTGHPNMPEYYGYSSVKSVSMATCSS